MFGSPSERFPVMTEDPELDESEIRESDDDDNNSNSSEDESF